MINKDKFPKITTSTRCRISNNQKKSIKKYFSLYGLNFQNYPLDWNKVFNRINNPIILEIGFGTGESLINSACRFPEINFLGVELYSPGIGSVLKKLHVLNLKNIRIIHSNAIEVLTNMIKNNELTEVRIFFPDPWPKRKHQKRRILQKKFCSLISKKLISGGVLHIITDSKQYLEYILRQINLIDVYVNLFETHEYKLRTQFPIHTKFESKSIKLGKKIFNLIFKCKK